MTAEPASPAEQLRAGLYQRVSILGKRRKGTPVRRDGGRSVHQQDDANTAACDRRGWAIAERYADPGKSASRFARTAREDYERLLTDVRAGRLDVIVFWEASRGGRELVAWATLLAECRDRDVKIYVTTHDHLYDLRRGRDWRTLAEDGVDSAYESEKDSDRIRRDTAANAAAGRPHGRLLYGYERVYDEHTKELIEQRPAPGSSEVVAEVITRVAAGEPGKAIHRDLAARGVRSPGGGPLYPVHISRIARNPAYAGLRSHNGTLTPAIWEPLVPVATWHRANAILDDQSRQGHRPGSVKHLLSFVATCGRDGCGGWLAAEVIRGAHSATGGRLMYQCEYGKHLSMRADWLDAYVTGVTCGLLDSPVFWAEISRKDDDDLGGTQAQIAELEAALREWRKKAVALKITPESFAEIEAGLTADLRQARKRAEAENVPAVLRGLGGLEDARRVFEGSPVAARKRVLRELFSEIVLLPARRQGKQPFDPERVRITRRGGESVQR